MTLNICSSLECGGVLGTHVNRQQVERLINFNNYILCYLHKMPKMNEFLWVFVAKLLVLNGFLALDMHFASLISVFALWVIVEELNYGI